MEPHTPSADIEDRLLNLLIAARLRRTPTRLAVLQVTAKATVPMSHADIEAALAVPLDRVTLYRTLDSFVEAGILRRHVGADRVGRFALVDGVDHEQHSHFHCDDCGNVYCMPVKPPRNPTLPSGFAVEGAQLSFHGHCPDCLPPGQPAAGAPGDKRRTAR